ncbi:MAG: sulfite exporter TauE/SafE family protein [Xanthomonadaceae bacterium]|nr:sulfite exporter TauE/SafE family protein [Xanthomonadaceae bacterium]
MMLAAAIVGAILIGLSLGLLGSGGSILTVPVLVYVLGQPEKVAIAGSLAIVGAIAAVGAAQWSRSGMIHWRSVGWFGIPGIAGTVGGAWASVLVTGETQLLVFAGVMLTAAWFMLRPPRIVPPSAVPVPERALPKVVADGLAVGALTGFVGVGGGFLIIPALVLLARLDMHRAVATSLVIIALKSFAGFAKYLPVLAAEGLSVDWHIIGLFSAVGAAGTVAGNHIGRRIPQAALKRGFGLMLIPMALYILWRSWP